MAKAERPTYRVVVQPLPDESDPLGYRRLRAWLKAGLRGYRLQCVDIGTTLTAEELAAAERDTVSQTGRAPKGGSR